MKFWIFNIILLLLEQISYANKFHYDEHSVHNALYLVCMDHNSNMGTNIISILYNITY